MDLKYDLVIDSVRLKLGDSKVIIDKNTIVCIIMRMIHNKNYIFKYSVLN